MMKPLSMMAVAPSTPMAGDEEQEALGFRHCHQQLNSLSQEIFKASAQLGAVVNALHARGLVDDEELAAGRAAEEQRLAAVFQEKEIGVQIDAQTGDKYAIPADSLPQIDCASRYHLCHGACCSLRFPLSKQDLDEGVVRWEYGRPYMIRHADDHACAHKDRETNRCTVYEHRPGICRLYDCCTDERIWQDFDRGIVNPLLFAALPDGQRRPLFNPAPSAASDVSAVSAISQGNASAASSPIA